MTNAARLLTSTPKLRLLTPMPTDPDDPRASPTTPAPAPLPSESPTNTENEAPVPRTALRPLPLDPWDTAFLDQDDSVFARAVKMIADAARANEAAAKERKGFEEQHTKLQNEILTSVQRAEQAQDANFKIIHHELHELKASDVRQDGRLAQGDERFQQIERSIIALKDELIALVTREMQAAATKIEKLEAELAKAKTDASRPPQAPATGQ